jgi:predicted RNase H-like HicB family nuclease
MKPATYGVTLTWSDDDEAYIAKVLELPGCRAHGDTRQEALTHIELAIQDWLDTARELHREIPPPMHVADYEKLLNQRVEERRQEIEEVANKALINSMPAISEQLAKYLARSDMNVWVSYREGEGIRTVREVRGRRRVGRGERKLAEVLKHRSQPSELSKRLET